MKYRLNTFMNDNKKLYVFDWVLGIERMEFSAMTKDEFMYSYGIEGGNYETWRGTNSLDDVQDCLSRGEALEWLKERLEDDDITQEQYVELTAEVKAVN